MWRYVDGLEMWRYVDGLEMWRYVDGLGVGRCGVVTVWIAASLRDLVN